MSSYISKAINWEVKSSEHSDLIDTQVIYPGGTRTGLFNRPESGKFSRVGPMTYNTCQSTPAAVAGFLHSLKAGYTYTWGSFFCEAFTRATFFGICGNIPPIFNNLHMMMGEYFTPSKFDGIPENEDDAKKWVAWHFFNMITSPKPT